MCHCPRPRATAHVCLVGVRLLDDAVGILDVLGTGIRLPVALLDPPLDVAGAEVLVDTGVLVRLIPPAVGSGETAAVLPVDRWCGELLTGVLDLDVVVPVGVRAVAPDVLVAVPLTLVEIGVVLLAGTDLGGGVLRVCEVGLCLGEALEGVAVLTVVVVEDVFC